MSALLSYGLVTGCSENETTRSNVVTLEILADGSFVWNGEHIPNAETLDGYWKAAAAQNPKPEIHLRPTRDAKYDTVARALEGAQKNGVTKLGFVGNLAP